MRGDTHTPLHRHRASKARTALITGKVALNAGARRIICRSHPDVLKKQDRLSGANRADNRQDCTVCKAAINATGPHLEHRVLDGEGGCGVLSVQTTPHLQAIQQAHT